MMRVWGFDIEAGETRYFTCYFSASKPRRTRLDDCNGGVTAGKYSKAGLILTATRGSDIL